MGQFHDFRPSDRAADGVPVLGGEGDLMPAFGAAGSRARAGGVRAQHAA